MPNPRIAIQLDFDAREAARQAGVIAKHFAALAAELDGQEQPQADAESGRPRTTAGMLRRLAVQLRNATANANPVNVAYNLDVIAAELDRGECCSSAAVRNHQLEQLATDIISRLNDDGHPGCSAVRTHWLELKTVERWKAVLRGEAVY
jgi:hypothetical protein